MTAAPAVFDTSVFIRRATRSVGDGWAPIVSVITIAELKLGVRLARTKKIAARRATTLADASKARIVPIDERLVADAWCELRDFDAAASMIQIEKT